MNIEELQNSDNVAELLEDEQLKKIGNQVVNMYEYDLMSLSDWKDTLDKAMDIAKQTIELKNEPWENASNIKFPLITRAGIDFAARTYPEFIQNSRVVKAAVIGDDIEGTKAKKASRVSSYISWQLLKQSSSWEESTDRMLSVLGLVGTVFRKTYYDDIQRAPISEFCLPENVVVNYKTTSLEEARRISHVLHFDTNRLLERMRDGTYCDVPLDELRAGDGYDAEDEDATLCLIEQHCFLDLDEDGYKEPYIVIVHKATRRVLRIVSRFENVYKNDNDEIVRIEPQQFFTDYHFIRSLDGGFYSIGLGSLLLPLNAAINTLWNQLIDSGTLNNRQGGFIGRGLRLKNGEFKSTMGTWHVMDASSGTNLQQNIVPFPTKEPSSVLFQLLGMAIEAGRDLISSTNLTRGQGETQNVSPTTVLSMIQQGMKIYQGISKRLYNSFTKEFKKIYKINCDNLTQKEYATALGNDPEANVKDDFNCDDYSICPVADPAMTSDSERLIKAQAVMSTPGIDMYQAAKFYLETLQIDHARIDILLPQPNPQAPPPAEVQKDLAQAEMFKAQAMELQARAQVEMNSAQIEMQRVGIETQDAQTRAHVAAASTMKTNNSISLDQHKAMMNQAKLEHKAQMDQVKIAAQVQREQAAAQLEQFDVVGRQQINVEKLALKDKELNIKAKEVDASEGTETAD